MAWRYVQIRSPSALAKGRSRARAPVATMMCLAWSSVVADLELPLACQRALAFDHGDLVLLHQPLDAGIELARNLAASVDDLGEVEAHLLRSEPVGGGVGQIMVDLGRAQQRLGRDAPPVEADPAKLLPLDDGRL
jgi:hypothetical protein